MPNRPFPATLTDAFDAAAASFGDRIAVDDLVHSLTYRELAARVDRLARAILAQGTREEEPVGLCTARGVDLIVGLLAVLKAGCAYVPMPPEYPVERLRTMADEIQLRHIVTDRQSAEIARTLASQVLEVGAETVPPACSEPPVRADWLAYIMFTSGSSGIPKGVMIEHGNVISLLNGCDQLFEIDEHDVWAMIHSYAFDFSVWEIWGALAYGGRLLILPREVVRSPESLWDACVQRGVTVLSITPSYFTQVSAAAQFPAGSRAPGTALRYVVFGGEALPMATLGPWYRRFPGTAPQLVNMYGITETTVHSTAQFLDESFADRRASIIGRPLPHLGIHLLDPQQRPVADGEVGEIYVSGKGVARGYYGRPGLTAERFATTAVAGRRTYRSGDLARRAADGSLEYIGRADAQVKVRGFRVEPGEIEACMLGYPGMRQVVIVPRQGDPDGRLVAYFVADDEIDMPAMRSFIGRRLPEFMVPAFFRRVSSIQLTINGKADRGALPPLETVDGAGNPPAVDGVAAKLTAIWERVLGLPTVGIDQDFFTVGGDSLTAIRVVRSCRAEGVNFKIADLYQHTTIRGLTAFLESDPVQR